MGSEDKFSGIIENNRLIIFYTKLTFRVIKMIFYQNYSPELALQKSFFKSDHQIVRSYYDHFWAILGLGDPILSAVQNVNIIGIHRRDPSFKRSYPIVANRRRTNDQNWPIGSKTANGSDCLESFSSKLQNGKVFPQTFPQNFCFKF